MPKRPKPAYAIDIGTLPVKTVLVPMFVLVCADCQAETTPAAKPEWAVSVAQQAGWTLLQAVNVQVPSAGGNDWSNLPVDGKAYCPACWQRKVKQAMSLPVRGS
jgi:hypothetical protein